MNTLWQDIRYGLRMLRKSWLLTAIVTVSLAVGIGSNTVVFTWIHAVLLDALPGVADRGRLMVLCLRHKTAGLGDTMSLPDIRSLSEQKDVFAGITASQMAATTLQEGERTEWIWAQFALANYFDVLGVNLVLGRGFRPGEDEPGTGGPVAVISHGLWQRRFGGDPSVLGRVVQVNSRPVTIVGVTAPAFKGTMGGLRFDLWATLPVQMEASALRARFEQRNNHWVHTIARLAPGVSLSRAQAAAASIASRLEQEFPQTNRDTSFAVLPLWKCPWGGQGVLLPVLRVLALVAGLLLLLVAVNVANLLLTRAHRRRCEMAVRLALGASRLRMVRQLLTESLVLALLGGLCGTLGALWGMHLLGQFVPPTYLPVAVELHLNGPVLGATLAVTLLAGLIFGLAPALQSVRTDLGATIKAGGRSAASSPRHWLRGAFVVGEVALALVLLLGMGLCVRSLEAARRADLGLDPHRTFVAGFRLSPHVGDDASIRSFYHRLRTEAAGLPGIEASALTDWLPLGFEGGSASGVEIPGYQPAPGEDMSVKHSIVSPHYFAALRIPVLRGREFIETDDAQAPSVAVVNEAFVARYLKGQEPLGQKIGVWGRQAQIVGVAKNGKYRTLNEPLQPFFYMCQKQIPLRDFTLIVRAGGDTAGLAGMLERLATTIDPALRPFAAMPYEDYIGAAFTVPRLAAAMLSCLGLLALLLAVLGIYAVIATNVNERVREMGLRIALGAQPTDIIGLVLRRGVSLTLVGLALGAVAGIAASRLLAGLLVGVGPGDLLTWLAVPLLLLISTALACWLPARRAARVDPMIALRCE